MAKGKNKMVINIIVLVILGVMAYFLYKKSFPYKTMNELVDEGSFQLNNQA